MVSLAGLLPAARRSLFSKFRQGAAVGALACIGVISPNLSWAQAQPAMPAPHVETPEELTARIPPAQQAHMIAANTALSSHQYADALASYKEVLKDLPDDQLLNKLASNAAYQIGDFDFVVTHLKPVVAANPDDWQALMILTRAYAQSGDSVSRDAAIGQMLALHKRGVTPPSLKDYIVEWRKMGDKLLSIRTSLEPWGYYKVYNWAELRDSKGTLLLSISIESSDFDQVPFAKNHPKEAAAGIRQFSLDAYQETGLNAAGQRTQTHYTFGFFTGQPTYDTVRDDFIRVASGTAKPVSSRANLIAP